MKTIGIKIQDFSKIIGNSAVLAFKMVEDAFAGEAENAGFSNEEEMQDYMKEIRKEVRGY